jgi:putative salt-induced outer membrane protein
MFKKLCITSIIFTTFSYSFIHIDPPVIGEKEGLKGEVSISGKHSSGNNDSTSVGLAGKGEYFGDEWLVYLIASYTYGESNDKKDTNDGSAHLRYVHSIGDTSYDYELFLQTEFNEFQNIKQRNLMGANLRKKLDTSFDKLYAGLGLFYSYMEPDVVSVYDRVYKRIRMNSYVSFSKKIHQNFSISYLGYYQPNVEDLSDYRISQILQFNTSITDDLVLGLDVNHAYNTTPYQNVEKSDIRTTVNLRYKF